jgi:hypothetical protein
MPLYGPSHFQGPGKQMSRKTILIGLIVFLSGCGGGRTAVEKTKGDRTLVAHSEGVEPLWIQECPARTDHTLPFCGEAHRVASQKMACSQAYADALGKLRRAIGQKVDAKLVPDQKGGYTFQIQGAESEPLTIRGAWEDQRWSEEYQGSDGRTHDCYVMIAYPKLEYDNLIGVAKKAAGDRVAKAAELHAGGKDLASMGRHAEAAVRFKRASALLAGLKEPVVTPDGMSSDLLAEQVLADLRVSQEEADKSSKTALVVVRMVIEGKPQPRGSLARSVRNRVKNWLSKRGIRIRPGGLSASMVEAVLSGDRHTAAKTAADKGAGLLLVIEIESEFKAKEDDVFYAFARGAFRLIRTADGRELHAADLGPEKQGHPGSRKGAVKLSVEKLRDKQLVGVVQEALTKL